MSAEAERVRLLYGQGVPLAEIARRTGLATSTLYRWIDRRVDEDGSVIHDPLPRRRPPVTGAKAAANGAGRAGAARARLLARLWFAAERQVAQIEARMAEAAPGAARADAEKDAKALALLARTLRELAAIEDEARAKGGRAAGKKGQQAKEGETNGADVRDRDAFRRELARRLDRLRGAGPGEPPA